VRIIDETSKYFTNRCLSHAGTNSAAGLNATTRMIQRQGRHGNGVPVVVIFLTDGKSNEPPETKLEANNLHTTLPEVEKMSPFVETVPFLTHKQHQLWAQTILPSPNQERLRHNSDVRNEH